MVRNWNWNQVGHSESVKANVWDAFLHGSLEEADIEFLAQRYPAIMKPNDPASKLDHRSAACCEIIRDDGTKVSALCIGFPRLGERFQYLWSAKLEGDTLQATGYLSSISFDGVFWSLKDRRRTYRVCFIATPESRALLDYVKSSGRRFNSSADGLDVHKYYED
jgi:hypothetical protein